MLISHCQLSPHGPPHLPGARPGPARLAGRKECAVRRRAIASLCCAQQTGTHIGCGSTAYSVGTVYGGKGRLYTPDVCPALVATSCLASLATPGRFADDHV